MVILQNIIQHIVLHKKAIVKMHSSVIHRNIHSKIKLKFLLCLL